MWTKHLLPFMWTKHLWYPTRIDNSKDSAVIETRLYRPPRPSQGRVTSEQRFIFRTERTQHNLKLEDLVSITGVNFSKWRNREIENSQFALLLSDKAPRTRIYKSGIFPIFSTPEGSEKRKSTYVELKKQPVQTSVWATYAVYLLNLLWECTHTRSKCKEQIFPIFFP